MIGVDSKLVSFVPTCFIGVLDEIPSANATLLAGELRNWLGEKGNGLMGVTDGGGD
jgi:hypothetical protein